MTTSEHDRDLAETISAYADVRPPRRGRIRTCASTRSGRCGTGARVTYVSGEIVGLRGPMGANDVFTPRDLVTLHVRSDEIVFESHARVLATGGHTMRILTERGLVAAERRAAPRIHASPFVMLTPLDGRPALRRRHNWSTFGRRMCDPVRLPARDREPVALDGDRTARERDDRPARSSGSGGPKPTAWFHAGIQFDPMPAADQGRSNDCSSSASARTTKPARARAPRGAPLARVAVSGNRAVHDVRAPDRDARLS